MTWNYRVVRTKAEASEGGYCFAIHEVYYEDGEMTSWTVNAIPAMGDCLMDVSWALDRMKEALAKPILDGDGEKLVEII